VGLQGAWDERWAVLANGLRGLRRRQRGVLARPAVPGEHERVLPGRMGKRAPRGRPATRSRRPTRLWPRTSALDRGLRIDYVFVRCDDSLHGPTLDVRARIRAFAESVGGVWVSDHFGFVAELSVPDVCS
jgi:hypothetical protein